MAFDRHDPATPTERWKGSIETVLEDGSFIGVIGPNHEDRTTLIEIPVVNITEEERSRVAHTIMFFADVEVVDGNVATVRGIELIEPEPLDL
mgnify:CR=1 FL=1